MGLVPDGGVERASGWVTMFVRTCPLPIYLDEYKKILRSNGNEPRSIRPRWPTMRPERRAQ